MTTWQRFVNGVEEVTHVLLYVFQSCVRSQESFLGLYQKCTGASKKASLGDLTKLSYRQRLPK
jgi:hypothetical protein